MAENSTRAEAKLAKLQASPRKGLEELALEVSTKLPDLELSAADTRKVIGAFLDAIVESLHRDRNVLLTSFGSFSFKKRPARKVRNPRATDPEQAFKEVGPSTAFRFKPGVALKTVFDSED